MIFYYLKQEEFVGRKLICSSFASRAHFLQTLKVWNAMTWYPLATFKEAPKSCVNKIVGRNLKFLEIFNWKK